MFLLFLCFSEKERALDSVGGLNMANCGGLHNNCGENTSLEHFKQVWRKSFNRERGAAAL
jgi:hypothetical protein